MTAPIPMRLIVSNASAPKEPDKLLATPFCRIGACVDQFDFVEGLLGEGGLSVWFGASNVGKTFVVLDLALHVAAGLQWLGRAVDQGVVVYLALEGGFGVRNRIAAWKIAFAPPDDIPFHLVARSIAMSGEGCEDAIQLIKSIAGASSLPLRLVVVDTLSRALAGEDENNSAAMGAFVLSMDRIRQETGAHIALIHHTGKDQTRGARGHSLLKAAIDTEIEVTKGSRKKDTPQPDLVEILSSPIAAIDETIIATPTKQRDLPCEGAFAFVLEQVPLGTNRRGKPVSSCVLKPVAARVR